MTTLDRLMLGRLATRFEDGSHFMGLCTHKWIEKMESRGLIKVTRPVHPKTDLPYGEEEWSVEVSSEVGDWFDDRGVLIGSEELYDEDGELPFDPFDRFLEEEVA